MYWYTGGSSGFQVAGRFRGKGYWQYLYWNTRIMQIWIASKRLRNAIVVISRFEMIHSLLLTRCRRPCKRADCSEVQCNFLSRFFSCCGGGRRLNTCTWCPLRTYSALRSICRAEIESKGVFWWIELGREELWWTASWFEGLGWPGIQRFHEQDDHDNTTTTTTTTTTSWPL